jgi:hypothetical protein
VSAVRTHVCAGLLIAAFFLQSFFASRIKSPVFDEPPHIAAGMAYLQKDNFRPNPQHPPLIKEMAAVSMLLAGIRLPQTRLAAAMLQEAPDQPYEWLVGNSLIAANGPARLLFFARLPMICLSTLLALLIYLWGRRLTGDLAALAALLIFTLDPNLLGHSAFVTTDMGLAAFGTAFFFALWLYLQRPATARLLLCGLAMGLAFCAKFSAVAMLPAAFAPMLASRTLGLRGVRAGRAFILRLAELAFASLALCCIAALVMMAVYRSPAALSMYWHGITSIYADSTPGYLYYMAGHKAERFYSYFAVAWLLKEPIAAIALVLLGSAVLLRNRSLPLLDKLFLFLPPALLFAAATLAAHDIGIRYIIPAFPFACLAGGAGLAGLIRRQSPWTRGLAALLVVWMVIAAAGIYPDSLSYFNEAACLLTEPAKTGWDGGSKCGPRWLDDSNVDWGQGLVQLRAWLKAHPDPRTLRMAYFGSFPPEGYGIASEPYVLREDDQLPAPGLYAISANRVARNGDAWPATTTPTAIVGHAIYIYDIGQP